MTVSASACCSVPSCCRRWGVWRCGACCGVSEMALLLSAVLLFGAFALLLGQWLRQRRSQRLVEPRLQGRAPDEPALRGWLQRMGDSRLGQRSLNLDGETRQLLDRVGWRRSSQRSLFAACQVGLPLCLMGAAVLVQEVFFRESR